MNIIKKLAFLLDRQQKRGLVFIFILMFVGMVFESLGVALILPLLAAVTKPDAINAYPIVTEVTNFIGITSQKQLIIGSLVSIMAVYFLKAAFLLYSGWIQGKFTAGLKVNISQKLFTTYMRQPYVFHLQRNSAQLIRNVTDEVFEFVLSVAAVLSLLSEFLIISGICAMLFIVEPLGLISIIITVTLFGSLFYMLTRGRTLELGNQRQFHEFQVLQHLQQGIGGFKDATLLGREENFIQQYVRHSSASARVGVVYGVLMALPRHMFELLSVTVLSVFIFVLLFILDKDADVIIPSLGVFVMAAFKIMPSSNKIIGSMQSLRYSIPVINRIYDEMLLPVKNSIHNEEIQKKQTNNIHVKDVYFQYSDSSDSAIHAVNININDGSVVGFIGPSGAGKSTLINVILGLLKPVKGQVLVNEMDIQNNMRSWQNRIGYVPQSIYLTDDTLKNNVAFGIPESEIDIQSVNDAISQSQLKEFVEDLPQGIETMVGENGVRLSGGQRQRIGIARALYHQPSVLVLDEATSALDSITESEVMDTIESLHGNKTIIIIAHRISTLKNCDCIYKLKNGTIIDKGNLNRMVNTN
ncbi:ABC transporter ATP-binding protein/permease [Candidatus Thioglobus sp.]|nr:ABC transporter ATP-binding protein/permease [Candidatus Thioglobus sp.]